MLIKEAWQYIKTKKAYWLIPLIITIIIVGILIVLVTATGSVSPYIYAFF